MADRKCANCIHLEVCAICKPRPFDQGCDNYLELVRCKDCKHRDANQTEPGGCHLCNYHSCDRKGHERYLYVEGNDFCSCGERKDNG